MSAPSTDPDPLRSDDAVPLGSPGAGAPGAPASGASEGRAPAPDEPADGPGVDLGRRTFFRRVAGELVQTAASLAGAATVAQGAVAGAAAAARELELGAEGARTDPAGRPTASGRPSMERLARERLAGMAPWTWDGERLLLLDARRLPGSAAAFVVGSASEAARAIRERVVVGPSAAAVAVWGLALSADAAAGRDAATRDALVTGAERTLLAAGAGSPTIPAAMASMRAALAAGTPPRPAADDLVARFTTDHDQLADALAARLLALGVRSPLLHGLSGPLWGAGAGVGPDALVQLRAAGVALTPSVTEGRPWLDGARITCWELQRLDLSPLLLLDAGAAGAVLAGRADAVVCTADRVGMDGSATLSVGAWGLAVAAAHARVPFIVAAAGWAVDHDQADAWVSGERPAPTPRPAVPLAPDDITRIAGTRIAPDGVAVDGTRTELVPAALISHLVTARIPHPPTPEVHS